MLTQIRLIRTPYIKTYRLPTPLLTFQLALIPGSLLTGFLLSPLLYLSRHLGQRPAHRLRFPNEKVKHRRLLAIGFYVGSLIICGGLVGTWTRWCLNWRDPVLWVIWWMKDGNRWWTRPALIGYWGALAIVSVAGWTRQLNRARRHRRYVVPGTKDAGAEGKRPGGVATQMMDAADQRLPTLSVNSRRKFFHALAVVMFVPGIAVDVSPRCQILLIQARLHAPGLFGRLRRLQLCRVHPLFRSVAIRRFGPPVPKRVSGRQGLGYSHSEPFLLVGRVCQPALARRQRSVGLLRRPRARSRGCFGTFLSQSGVLIKAKGRHL
jgi:hypothetical protein